MTVTGVQQFDGPLTPEHVVAADQLSCIVRGALEHLNENCRHALELRYFHELSYREIACILGITPNNAGVRIARALTHLKARLPRCIDGTDLPHPGNPTISAAL